MAATGHTAGDVQGDWIYDNWAAEATEVAADDSNVWPAAEPRDTDDVVGHRCKSEFFTGDLSADCDQSDVLPRWAIVLSAISRRSILHQRICSGISAAVIARVIEIAGHGDCWR